MKKLVLVILDGLGDLPDESIGGKTPLEHAQTPGMDALARDGRCGRVYTVGKGFAPESDGAMFALMGYDPFESYTGRSAFEALGLGIRLRKGMVAMRGNLATAEDGKLVDVRAGRIKGKDAEELVQSLKEVELSIPFEIHKQEGYRFLVVFKSPELSSWVTNTHPGYTRTEHSFSVARQFKIGDMIPKCEPMRAEAGRTAEVVNEFVAKASTILEKHPVNRDRKVPANYVLLRDAADGLPEVKTLEQKFGLSWGAVTERTVEKGMCTLGGMEMVKVPKEPDLAKDCKNKVEAALANIKNYDCLYVYMKGPDKPGHDGDAEKKARIIEEIDKHLVAGLVKGLDMDSTVISITSDHSTPCQLRSHSDDPVPLLVYGGERDRCSSFSETECEKGSIGTIQGKEVMEMLVETLNFKIS